MKELKDYLPFYIGCECVTPDGVMIFNCLNVNDNRNNVWFYCRWNDKKNCYEPKKNAEVLLKSSCVGKSFKYSEIKLILRSLSDMTKKEQEEYDGIDNFQIEFCSDEQALRMECEAEKTQFLLSKRFDLFGLIEAGLAIDSTTLKTAKQ